MCASKFLRRTDWIQTVRIKKGKAEKNEGECAESRESSLQSHSMKAMELGIV